MRLFKWIKSWWKKPEPAPVEEKKFVVTQAKGQKPVVKTYSPPKPKKPKACISSGKRCLTEKQAKDHAARSNAFPRLRAYKCMFCEWWHVTHHKNKLTMH